MGLKLSSVYQKSESIISELSIRMPNKEEISLMNDGIKRWNDVHGKGRNISIQNEGFVTTVSAEFNLEEIHYANLFTVFMTNSLENENSEKNYGYDDEDSRDIE